MSPVLVTGALGPAGRSLLTELRRRSVPVTGVDCAATPGDRGREVPVLLVPRADDPLFGWLLSAAARRAGATLVVPTVSEELPVLASAPLDLPGVEVLVGPAAAVLAADDKLETCELLRENGVAVPWFARGDRFDPLGWSPPVLVVKPRTGRGGRGVRVLRRSQVTSWPGRELGRDVVVQEFVPGEEYVVDLHRPGPDVDPSERVAVVLAKTGLAQGLVGNATGVRRVHAPAVAEVAWRAVEALGLTGPADVDVRLRADSTPVVLEVNARFGAHSASAPEVLDAVLRHRARLGSLA